MTTDPAAEALLADEMHDRFLLAQGLSAVMSEVEFAARLAAIQSEARATADAEVARLTAERDALRTALATLAELWERESEGGWAEQQPWRIRRQHANALRAALAPAAPVAASVERCGYRFMRGDVCDSPREASIHRHHPFQPAEPAPTAGEGEG